MCELSLLKRTRFQAEFRHPGDGLLGSLEGKWCCGSGIGQLQLQDIRVRLTIRTHLLCQLHRLVKGGRFGVRHIVDDTCSTLRLSTIIPSKTVVLPPN